MSSEERFDSQSLANAPLDGYRYGPQVGPGRWMKYPDGTTIFTDDDQILGVKNNLGTPLGTVDALVALRKLFKAGKTATEGFESLRGHVPVVSGDLSELA